VTDYAAAGLTPHRVCRWGPAQVLRNSTLLTAGPCDLGADRQHIAVRDVSARVDDAWRRRADLRCRQSARREQLPRDARASSRSGPPTRADRRTHRGAGSRFEQGTMTEPRSTHLQFPRRPPLRQRCATKTLGCLRRGVRQAVARRGRSARPRTSKNRAWLMTAFTFSGRKGLVIRKVGSGRVPVRSRSG